MNESRITVAGLSGLTLLSLLSVVQAANEDYGFKPFDHGAKNGGTLPYRLFCPTNIQEGKKYPLVVAFHGAGSVGADNLAQVTAGYGKVFADPKIQAGHPCFVVAPQCPAGRRWVDTDWGKTEHNQPAITPEMRMALEIVDKILSDYPIDRDRIYVHGQSMGGFAVWDVICRRPDMFAAAVPVCGGGDETKAAIIKDIPIWAFHGALDPVVKVICSRNMIAAVKKAGGSPRYTEYAKVEHDAWNYAYKEPGLVDWVFRQCRRNEKGVLQK